MAEAKVLLKIVVKLDLHDDKVKQKAIQAVSGLIGLDKMEVDMKLKKMTLVGLLDPVDVVNRLKKAGHKPSIELVGPVKEPKKEEKEPEKKKKKKEKEPEKKKEKKEEGKKVKEVNKVDPVVEYVKAYRNQNPNACVIC